MMINVIEGKGSKTLEWIYNECEDYDILNKPMLPKFACPNGLSEEDYLTSMAREGYRNT